MVFQYPWQLERHLKFSQMHARNVEAINAKENGIVKPDPQTTYYDMKLQWEVRKQKEGHRQTSRINLADVKGLQMRAP